jgi:RNA polymerase sigma-70 factor (ECF subfamily)
VSGDVELLEAWRHGDQHAGDALLARHFDAVCRFFRSKLGDDVEDLIQRTFLDCVESRDRVTPRVGFRAYLFGIARNRLYDHLRRANRRPSPIDGNVESVEDLGTSPSARVVRGEEQRLLLRALRRIPTDAQVLLELAYWEGLRGPELAVVLGIPENTVRSRLSRARAALRRQVESLASSPEISASTLESIDARAEQYHRMTGTA